MDKDIGDFIVGVTVVLGSTFLMINRNLNPGIVTFGFYALGCVVVFWVIIRE